MASERRGAILGCQPHEAPQYSRYLGCGVAATRRSNEMCPERMGEWQVTSTGLVEMEEAVAVGMVIRWMLEVSPGYGYSPPLWW